MASQADVFPAAPGGVAKAKGRYVDLRLESPEIELAPGLTAHGGVGDQVMINVLDFQPGGEAPTHAHVEEQVMLVVEGELEFDLDGDVRVLGPGQAVFIPASARHGARAGTSGCSGVAILCPPQPALIARMLHEEHLEHGFE